MTLTLRINNFDLLEDGGPAWITLDRRGASVGRSRAMDWVLPDPAKHISGHHFDITFRDGIYWLSDVSTNGTFLEGQRYRLDGLHQISDGERLVVGHYVITAQLSSGATPPLHPPMAQDSVWGEAPATDEADPWDFGAGAFAPINPMPVKPANSRLLDDLAQDFVPLQRPVRPDLIQPPPPMPEQAPVWLPDGGPPLSVAPIPLAQPQPGQPAAVPMPPLSPMAPPQPQPMLTGAEPARTGPQTSDGTAVLHAFCEGAGLDTALLASSTPEALARELGRSVRIATEEIMRLLQDRANVKHFTKGGERTMRSATGNNPLKFLPDSTQALEAMFLKPRDGFMSGADGFDNALKDIRQHQMAVFAALQPALAKLLEGLSPDQIETATEGSGSLLGGSRRARAWDKYVENWDAKASVGDHGMLDAFLKAFAQAYAEANAKSGPL